MIDLAPLHLDEVRRILRAQLPHCEVLAYGSRVEGGAQRYSDLDLAVRAPANHAVAEQLFAARDAFSESGLPIMVDVVDWHDLPTTLRDHVRATGILLQPAP
jgi:predicted nucleotidyltransferase